MWQKPHIRVYVFVLAASLAGAGWLLVHYLGLWPHATTVCIIKSTTGVPCPACGSTRASGMLLEGNVANALQTNPIGVLLALLLPVLVVWIMRDLLLRKQDFYHFYRKTEAFLQKKWVAIPAILLVLANWAWNIAKEL